MNKTAFLCVVASAVISVANVRAQSTGEPKVAEPLAMVTSPQDPVTVSGGRVNAREFGAVGDGRSR